MALPQICCRALVDTHVLRYLYCWQLSQLLIWKSLSLRDRNLIKREFFFLFWWIVSVSVVNVSGWRRRVICRTLLWKNYFHKSLFLCLFFYRLPGKAFQTVFEQHPDSLVRVVQVCYKKKRFWFLTLRKRKRVELLPWASSDKICPCPTKYCSSRTLASLKPRRKLRRVNFRKDFWVCY